MEDDRERVIRLSTEVATLRLQVQQSEAALELLRERLEASERELDLLLSGSSNSAFAAKRKVADRVRVHFTTHPDRAFSPAEVSHRLSLGPDDQDALRQALHHLTQKNVLTHVARGAYQLSREATKTKDEKGPADMNTAQATLPSGSRMKHDITIVGKTFKALPLKAAMLEVVRQAVAAGIHPIALQLHLGTANAGTRWLQGPSLSAAKSTVTDESRWFIDHAFSVGDRVWILSSQWSWDEPYGSSRADLERIQKSFPQLGLTWQRY